MYEISTTTYIGPEGMWQYTIKNVGRMGSHLNVVEICIARSETRSFACRDCGYTVGSAARYLLNQKDCKTWKTIHESHDWGEVLTSHGGRGMRQWERHSPDQILWACARCDAETYAYKDFPPSWLISCAQQAMKMVLE